MRRPLDYLLTLNEVADLYAMSPATLSEQARTGRARVMPCMGGGPGNPYRWRASDVEQDIGTASISNERLARIRKRYGQRIVSHDDAVN